jgi:hypothetical protein
MYANACSAAGVSAPAGGGTCTALVDTLCYANLPTDDGAAQLTCNLRSSYNLVAAAISGLPPQEAAAFSWTWYIRVLARFQINHFRCAIPLPLHIADSHPELMHSGNSGAAVYTFGSLLNHSCCPNVGAHWLRGNATVSFQVLCDVFAGEELVVSYVETSLEANVRRRVLMHGWGIDCRCAACREELPGLGADL